MYSYGKNFVPEPNGFFITKRGPVSNFEVDIFETIGEFHEGLRGLNLIKVILGGGNMPVNGPSCWGKGLLKNPGRFFVTEKGEGLFGRKFTHHRGEFLRVFW